MIQPSAEIIPHNNSWNYNLIGVWCCQVDHSGGVFRAQEVSPARISTTLKCKIMCYQNGQ